MLEIYGSQNSILFPVNACALVNLLPENHEQSGLVKQFRKSQLRRNSQIVVKYFTNHIIFHLLEGISFILQVIAKILLFVAQNTQVAS